MTATTNTDRVRHLEAIKANATGILDALRREHKPDEVADDIAEQQREIRYCDGEIDRERAK